ncbi:MAG TPA: LysR family transcriptional regulator [Burkholderiales bacterium]|nr:LysR family transcriptional regulator [Burkholderiales bacterium]
MARYRGLTLRVLGRDAPAMGPGRAELISRIGKTGSISAAAREMGMSYRRAWQLVEAMNGCFNRPVVITTVGGRRGGGAQVTPFGKRLVALYRDMEHKASMAIAADLKRFLSHLRPRARRRRAR